jgi:antitoxin component YwqK of YwqJK toxin-antitoxin module
MKKNKLAIIFVVFLSILLVSCKNTKNITIYGYDKSEFSFNFSDLKKGTWKSPYYSKNTINSLTCRAEDSIFSEKIICFFEHGENLNVYDKKGRKKGFWILVSSKYVNFSFFKKGKLHGNQVLYANDGESVKASYKNGKLHGWWRIYMGDCAYIGRFYKKGKCKTIESYCPSFKKIYMKRTQTILTIKKP